METDVCIKCFFFFFFFYVKILGLQRYDEPLRLTKFQENRLVSPLFWNIKYKKISMSRPEFSKINTINRRYRYNKNKLKLLFHLLDNFFLNRSYFFVIDV